MPDKTDDLPFHDDEYILIELRPRRRTPPRPIRPAGKKPAAPAPRPKPRGGAPKTPPGSDQLKAIDRDFAPSDVGSPVGECAKEFAKGFAEGGIIAFVIAALVAVLAPELLLLVAIAGLAGLAADAIDLAANWHTLSGPEKARRLGTMAGGLLGGPKGVKAGRGLRSGGDPWVSGQGKRPAPGTRDVTRGQFREGDGTYRAKDTAEGYEGHGHGRHGAQTTTAEQTRRVQTGEAPDGNRAPTSKATRFDRHAKEVEAVERARAREPWNGQPQFRPDGRPNRVSTVVPDGPEGYGEGVQVQRGPNGQPLPGRPVEPTGRQPNANVVFEYNPQTGRWEPVTQYPTDDPVTP